MKILIVIAVVIFCLLLLFLLYSACVIASECSRIEENNYSEEDFK